MTLHGIIMFHRNPILRQLRINLPSRTKRRITRSIRGHAILRRSIGRKRRRQVLGPHGVVAVQIHEVAVGVRSAACDAALLLEGGTGPDGGEGKGDDDEG